MSIIEGFNYLVITVGGVLSILTAPRLWRWVKARDKVIPWCESCGSWHEPEEGTKRGMGRFGLGCVNKGSLREERYLGL